MAAVTWRAASGVLSSVAGTGPRHAPGTATCTACHTVPHLPQALGRSRCLFVWHDAEPAQDAARRLPSLPRCWCSTVAKVTGAKLAPQVVTCSFIAIWYALNIAFNLQVSVMVLGVSGGGGLSLWAGLVWGLAGAPGAASTHLPTLPLAPPAPTPGRADLAGAGMAALVGRRSAVLQAQPTGAAAPVPMPTPPKSTHPAFPAEQGHLQLLPLPLVCVHGARGGGRGVLHHRVHPGRQEGLL